jgi:copper chaperone CopZ
MRKRAIAFEVFGLALGAGGALTVERALVGTPGVERAYVNPATEMAYVEYDPALVDFAQLSRAVEQTGFRTGERWAR